MRGITPTAFRLHDGVEIASGSYPRSAEEVLIGDVLSRTLGGVRIGDSLIVGPRSYRVSGVLSAHGQVFAGEIWADLEGLQAETGQRGASALVLRIGDQAQVQSIAEQIASSRGLSVSARPEQDYYKDIQKASLPFVYLGNVIGLILGMGAVMAGMNTMYAAMSRRIRELGTLRALGFGRWYVGSSLLLESILIGALGGALGSAFALGFDGFALNLMGLSFELTVQPQSLVRGAILARGAAACKGSPASPHHRVFAPQLIGQNAGGDQYLSRFKVVINI
jgi:putative ABC transport system permease protein